jgi:hypothetical protein
MYIGMKIILGLATLRNTLITGRKAILWLI